jgi:hypothetical protein
MCARAEHDCGYVVVMFRDVTLSILIAVAIVLAGHIFAQGLAAAFPLEHTDATILTGP